MLEVRRARGAALKLARKAAGLSARKLVERVNARTAGSDITEHAIYAYESGRVQLSREVAERVAEVLKVPLGGLLVGDPDFADHPGSADLAREDASEGFGIRDRPPSGGDTEGPPEPGRWAATRSSLLARFGDADPAAAVLIRQLSARRFQAADPLIFAASFELLEADLSAMIESPEADWLGCRDDDRWHAPLLELLTAAKALRDAGREAWDGLDGSAAARRAAAAIEQALGEFRDAAGRARRLVSGGT